MTNSSLKRSGFWLLSDQIFGVIGGGVFWLIIARLATTVEIGAAAAIFGLSVFLVGLSTLGLEFVVLKEVSKKGSEIFGIFFVLQIITSTIGVVVSIIILHYAFPYFSNTIFLLGIFLLLSLSFKEFATYSMIGQLRGDLIAKVDLISICSKFVIGILLVSMGFGITGILSAMIIHTAFSTIFFLIFGIKKFGIQVTKIKNVIPLIKLALGNYINKIAKVVTLSLPVFLLPIISSDLATTGIFFLQLTIVTIMISSTSVLAILSIPGSRVRNEDISPATARLGLYLVSPLISVCLATPSLVLAIFGNEYTSHNDVFRILIVSVIPAVILWNFISSLNTLSDKNKLVKLGLVQLITFSVVFLIMVQNSVLYAAAFAVFSSLMAGGSYGFISMKRRIFRPLLISTSSIFLSVIIGILVLQLTASSLASAAISLIICIIIIIKIDLPLKEIKSFIHQNK